MSKWIWKLGAVMLAAFGLLQVLQAPALKVEAQGAADAAATPPAPVKVAEAIEMSMTSTLRAPGTVVSRNDARIAAEIPGRLIWVADVGDKVAKGNVVARIDDQTLQLQLREAETRIKRLEVGLRYLERQEKRLKRLEAEEIAAQNQLDEIVSRREMAEQELLEAGLARDQTLGLIARTEIRAPFPGQVVERLGQLGEYTSVGGAVLRLVDIEHTEVKAQAPLSVAPHLKRGQEVTVQAEDRQVASRIRAVIPVGDERSRMIEIRVDLPAGWPVGAAVRVNLPQSGTRTTVSVPRDALILRQDNVYVFRVSGTVAGKGTSEETVERVDVEVGIADGSRIEVVGGIVAGDQVVIRGGERLQSGQTILVQP